MKKHRTLPFGYAVENGVTVIHEDEAGHVRAIFRLYAAGEPYRAIAANMTHMGVCYHAGTAGWNKNMVKRILENEKYLGRDGLPPIINEAVFTRAAAIRAGKQHSHTAPPEFISAVRGKVVCAECGAPMTRLSKYMPRCWACKEIECGKAVIQEQPMLEGLTSLLAQLAADPLQIDTTASHTPATSIEATRLINEINRETDKRGCDEELVLRLIYEAAAQKYAACGGTNLAMEGKRIRAVLQTHGPTDGFPPALFHEITARVLISTDKTITFALTNGQRFEALAVSSI